MIKTLENKKPVAVKYNGNQLDKSKTLSTFDYISVNCEGEPNFTELPKHITIEKQDYGTKVFKDVVNVIIDGVRFCGIVFNPRNPKLGEKLVQIKLENHILYTYPKQEIKFVFENFVKLINLKIKGVSRLDVAFDFEDSSTVFRDVIQNILTGNYLISGRTKKVSLFNEILNCYGNTKKGRVVHNGLSIGKKSNSRYLRIYNKSLEMEQIKYKHHIANFWKNGGFTDLSNVWRFEYALNSAFMREYNISFDDIFKEDFVVTVMKSAYHNHFILKENTEKKEINKEKTIPLFCFDKVKKVKTQLVKIVKEVSENIQRSIVSVKRQIKGLYRSHYSTRSDYFYDAMYIHLRNYDLVEWFLSKEEDYTKEFHRQALKLNKI